MTDGATEQFTDDMRNALIHIAGVRLGGNTFKMMHSGSFSIFVECRKSKGVLTPLKNPRKLMKAVVDKLEAQGFVELKADGADVLLVQTEKRA